MYFFMYVSNFLYPRKRHLKMYIGITLSFRPSVLHYFCLSICLYKIRVRFISFLWKNTGRSFFQQRLLMAWGSVMTLILSHSGKVRVTCKKSAKFVSGQNLMYGETLEVRTSHKDWFCPENVSWPWPKDIRTNSRA